MTTRLGGSGEDRSGDRCVIWRKCATCGQQTKHAYLRDGDPHADFAEAEDHEAQQELTALVEDLSALGVKVMMDHHENALHDAWLLHFLDDGTLRVALASGLTVADQRTLLQLVWDFLMADSPLWFVAVGNALDGGIPLAYRTWTFRKDVR